MHITTNYPTYRHAQHINLYGDLLLPQSLVLQSRFGDMHLLLYLNQHISIITY